MTGELGAALRDFLSAHATPVVPPEESEQVWSRLGRELGVTGLLVPEARGGLGFGPAELVEVATELGWALVGGAFVPSAVAATTALAALDGHEKVGPLLESVASGQSTVALVHAPLASPARAVRAARDGAGLALTGSVRPILAAPPPCPLLVPSEVDGDAVLALVEPGAPGAGLTPLPSLDLSRPSWQAEFADTPATVLATGPAARDAVERAEVAAWIALGGECVGLAAHALGLTVEHARTREQFGRPIGAFQAVQHRLADLTVALEVARSAAELVIRSAGADPGAGPGADPGAGPDAGPWRLRAAAHAFAVKASEAAVTISTEAIQLHGGIGYTWEHPAHRFLRRAHANAVLAGTAAQHRRALFTLLDQGGGR